MEIQRITRSWLRSNEACYSDYRLHKLVPEEGVTLQQVLETDRIPDGDKIWVATRRGLLPETIMAAWLAGIVERALGRLGNPDPRSLAVIPLLGRIASGEEVDQEERNRIHNEAYDAYAAADAAYAAADYAACHAADYAACYAADYAAYYAADYAADYAAYHAAWYAAYYASSAAQRDEERKQQVQEILALLED